MGTFEQLQVLKDNINKQHDPAILFAMNQKYRELLDRLESQDHIKNIEIIL